MGINIFHNLAYREKRIALSAKYEILEGLLRDLKLGENPRFLAMPGKDGFEEVLARSLGLENRRMHTIERDKLIHEYQRSQGYTVTEQPCELEDAIIEICRRTVKYDFVHFDFPSMISRPIQNAIELFLSKEMLKEDSIFLVTTISYRTSKKIIAENKELAGGTYKFPPTHLFLTKALQKAKIKAKVSPIPYTTENNYSATTCAIKLGKYSEGR